MEFAFSNFLRFWRALSSHVSKIDQTESAIHISGCTLEDSFQGREVVRFIQRLVQPSMVRVFANGDQTEKGKITVHWALYSPISNINKMHFYINNI